MEHLLHGNWLGMWHPIVVHFPIVLFSLTLMLDTLQGIGMIDSKKYGSYTLGLGLLFLIPTLVSGWMASEGFPPNDPTVQSHMLRAFILAPYAFLYGIMRLWGKEAPVLVYIALSLILVGLTYWTSDYGGVLSHGETPFST